MRNRHELAQFTEYVADRAAADEAAVGVAEYMEELRARLEELEAAAAAQSAGDVLELDRLAALEAAAAASASAVPELAGRLFMLEAEAEAEAEAEGEVEGEGDGSPVWEAAAAELGARLDAAEEQQAEAAAAAAALASSLDRSLREAEAQQVVAAQHQAEAVAAAALLAGRLATQEAQGAELTARLAADEVIQPLVA